MSYKFPVLALWLALLAGCATATPDGLAQLEQRYATPDPESPQTAPDPSHKEDANADAGGDASFGQDAPERTWSPAAIRQQIRQHNPNLEAMRHTLRAMIQGVASHTDKPDPTLDFGLSPFAVHRGLGLHVGYSQRFPWPGTLAAQADAALQAALAAEHRLEAAARTLEAAAEIAYWDLAATPAIHALWMEHHQLLATVSEAVLAQSRAGRGRPEDAVRADAELVIAEQALLTLAKGETIARARLNVAMHRNPESPLTPEPFPDALPPRPAALGDLLAATEERPEFRAAAAEAIAREYATRAIERANRPQLGFGVQLTTTEEDWTMWPMVTFSIDLPFRKSSRKSRIEEARAQEQAAQAEISATRDRLQLEIAEAHARLTEALDRHENFDALLLPSQKRRLDLVLASYAAGRADFDDVMRAAEALNAAALGQLEAKIAAYIAATQLELALGQLFTETP